MLLQELETFFKTSKKKTSTVIMGDNFIENIDAYLDIFPKFKLQVVNMLGQTRRI